MIDPTALMLTAAAIAALIVAQKVIHRFEEERHREALFALLRRLRRSHWGRYGMDGVQRPPMDEECLSKMKIALDAYSFAVGKSDLSVGTKKAYVTQAYNFIRWCEGKHTPGQREPR